MTSEIVAQITIASYCQLNVSHLVIRSGAVPLAKGTARCVRVPGSPDCGPDHLVCAAGINSSLRGFSSQPHAASTSGTAEPRVTGRPCWAHKKRWKCLHWKCSHICKGFGVAQHVSMAGGLPRDSGAVRAAGHDRKYGHTHALFALLTMLSCVTQFMLMTHAFTNTAASSRERVKPNEPSNAPKLGRG